MSKSIKNILGSLPGRKKVRPETPQPPMSDTDAAKLRRRQEIRARIGETRLQQIPESVFAGVTHDYIENGIGDLTKVVILLFEEAWLYKNTSFNVIEAPSRQRRFLQAVDQWLRERLLTGNWENIHVDEVPATLYATFVERMNIAWERFAIEEVLMDNYELYASILSEHPDDTPMVDGKIASILRKFYIIRNGKRQSLAAAMQERVGLTDYNAIIRRARDDVSKHARMRYISDFRRSKTQTIIRARFDAFFDDLIKKHVPRLAEDEGVHPELMVRAIRHTNWFEHDDE